MFDKFAKSIYTVISTSVEKSHNSIEKKDFSTNYDDKFEFNSDLLQTRHVCKLKNLKKMLFFKKSVDN